MQLNLEQINNTLPESVFIADNATVFGDVVIGDESSILFGAVVRGDTAAIQIGKQSNVQDVAVIHADPGFPTTIGDRVTIGHGAIVHGATIDDDVIIGMRAVILNGVTIGSGSIIAAGAVVAENTVIPPRSMVMGVPGKIRGQTTESHLAKIQHAAIHYVDAGRQYSMQGDSSSR